MNVSNSLTSHAKTRPYKSFFLFSFFLSFIFLSLLSLRDCVYLGDQCWCAQSKKHKHPSCYSMEHIKNRSLIHSFCLSCSHIHDHSLSLSHTHTHIRIHIQSLNPSLSLPLMCSVTSYSECSVSMEEFYPVRPTLCPKFHKTKRRGTMLCHLWWHHVFLEAQRLLHILIHFLCCLLQRLQDFFHLVSQLLASLELLTVDLRNITHSLNIEMGNIHKDGMWLPQWLD